MPDIAMSAATLALEDDTDPETQLYDVLVSLDDAPSYLAPGLDALDEAPTEVEACALRIEETERALRRARVNGTSWVRCAWAQGSAQAPWPYANERRRCHSMPGPVSLIRTVLLTAFGAACGGLVGWWTAQFFGHITIWIGTAVGSLAGALIERTMHARAVSRFEASHRDPGDPRSR